MRIYIGSDHAGYEYKKMIFEYLKANNYDVVECLPFEYDKDDDYNEAALDVATKILNDEDAKGILICGTGIGMSMAANRNGNIRAALCHSENEAKLTRLHNDANILCLGAVTTELQLAKNIVDTFLNTSFSNEERHVRRIEKLR